jgi:hypothetical protein
VNALVVLGLLGYLGSYLWPAARPWAEAVVRRARHPLFVRVVLTEPLQ